jgi:predicted transcriptional regulator
MKYNRLQRIVKGFANHRRIEILNLISVKPDLSLNQISESLDVNFKTISEHTRKMVSAGIITKTYKGAEVKHNISSRGAKVLKFLTGLDE